jgi:hypothetical protein
MAFTSIVNLFCAFCAIIQAVAAFLYISEWQSKSKTPITQMSFGKKIFAVILTMSVLVMVGFPVWLYNHPLRPIEKNVYVDKPMTCPTCPVCPAIKTGSATARSGPGGISIGHSGNGDIYTIPPAKPQK